MHTFMLLSPAFRTVAPFDWLAFLRQWRLEFVEVREGGRVYYRITGPLKEALGPAPCVYLPDDRTIVFDEEETIRKLAGQGAPPQPAFLRGPDWERASRGLLAVAIGNQDGAFAKSYDLKRPDDAVVLSLFKGVDRWTFAVEDADAIVLRAAAACRGSDVSEVIARSIDSLVKLGRDAIDHADPKAKEFADHERMLRMITSLMANLRVEHTDRSVGIHTDGFGTLADLASIIEAEMNEQKAQAPKGAKHVRAGRPEVGQAFGLTSSGPIPATDGLSPTPIGPKPPTDGVRLESLTYFPARPMSTLLRSRSTQRGVLRAEVAGGVGAAAGGPGRPVSWAASAQSCRRSRFLKGLLLQRVRRLVEPGAGPVLVAFLPVGHGQDEPVQGIPTLLQLDRPLTGGECLIPVPRAILGQREDAVIIPVLRAQLDGPAGVRAVRRRRAAGDRGRRSEKSPGYGGPGRNPAGVGSPREIRRSPPRASPECVGRRRGRGEPGRSRA